MIALIVAGELIFSLPFHVPRYFRPSVLAAFGFSNAALGDVFAVYGVTAMLSYFPGGLLADRFSARVLMAISLAATAAGGFYLATLPGRTGMSVLYGYWGVTTIFLFWAPMIRAARTWGGRLAQGRAFGILDGGRGLIAALFAGIGVWIFAGFLHDAVGVGALGDEERRAAVRAVILFYSAITLASSLLVLRFVPDGRLALDRTASPAAQSDVRYVLRSRVVWLQALVVVCAYCGYKGLDNYSLYVFEVLGLDEASAARFAAAGAYLRPVGAMAAGLLADRAGVAPVVAGSFAMLTGLYALLGSQLATPALAGLVYANLVVTMLAVFALRGVYFALLEETGVPASRTGAAVGLVSLVGFTPDVFFAAVAGRLLDATPGIGGHREYFLLLAGIAAVGWLASMLVVRYARERRGAGVDTRAELDRSEVGEVR
jgi:sugar phosphate permease